MASASPRALRQAIERRTFDPVYHFVGDNDFLKDEAVAQLLGAAVDPATRDFNLEVRRGAELDAETLSSLLATPPMMAERRAIVVRDVGALRKDARAALDRYLQRPQPDVLLVMVTAAGAKAEKGLDAAATIEYRALNDNEVARWIEHHVQLHGGSITQEAATLLFEAVGNDLPQLAQEIDKLVSYARGSTIDADAVGDAVGIRRGETLADLLDRLAERDAAGSIELLPIVLAQPKNSAVFIVMALATQTLALAWARAQRDAGMRSIDGYTLSLHDALPIYRKSVV